MAAETENKEPVRIVETPDWRVLFPAPMIQKAKPLVGSLRKEPGYYYYNREYKYSLRSGGKKYTVEMNREPYRFGDTWHSEYFSCTCPEGQKGMLCVHEAAMMLAIEKEHGPWKFVEPEYAFEERHFAWEMDQRREKIEEKKKQIGDSTIPALSFFGERGSKKGLCFLDFRQALQNMTTTKYALENEPEAEKHLQRSYSYTDPFTINTMRDGVKTLTFGLSFADEYFGANISACLEGGRFKYFRSKPTQKMRPHGLFESLPQEDRLKTPLSEYDLAAIKKAWDYVDSQKDFADQTDSSAHTFFQSLQQQADDREKKKEQEKTQELPKEKTKNLTISPRIIVEDGSPKLSFKTGRAGGKEFILRDLVGFCNAYQNEGTFQLTKKESVDFSRETYAPDYLPLMSMLLRKVGSIQGYNQKLESKSYYGDAQTLNITYQQDLTGSTLDEFYTVWDGKECEYQNKTTGASGTLKVGHADLSFSLRADRLSDARGNFAGVIVSGMVPVLVHGSESDYILNETELSRISKEEREMLRPFTSVADSSGNFRFQVGLPNLQEFYYRVLPGLMESPFVEFTDNCEEEASSYLPPEPQFTFYLDLQDNILSLKGTVAYDKKTYDVGTEYKGKAYRDREQEARVEKQIRRTFSHFDAESAVYTQPVDDAALYQFLTVGLEGLERYGTVQGTGAFTKLKVRSTPSVTVGISVESGLMDFTVTSKELSRDELLAVLESYSLKKRYHRLKNGDFVDLSQSDEIDEMEALLKSMNLKDRDVVEQKVKLPLFRALYLDHLLEEHDAIVSSRDRTFRALIKNFRTIRDADFEPPASLADTLRPYQSYGLKWLETLEQAGFGGILADEMGLGKTLELISVLLLDKENGSKKPSLVVCPASVVYNWAEEVRRFAPNLRAVPLAGTPKERKAALADSENTDVFITSYDLLKKDIALYHDLSFHLMAVDEAQFIKNPSAAQTKAVKTVRADHRFALTGTPIENRLSELWSIFDFIMPGFLYDQKTFQADFETPITKGKDADVTEKLRQMTGPFILRRKKEDVLKDLPAKLEEVRYAKLSGEQQKLYDAQVVHIKDMIGGGAGSGEDKIRILAELTRIREICCDPSLIVENYKGESAKRQACMELIHSAIDGGHRMLVFSQFTSMLALLEQDLQKDKIPYYKIIGETPKAKRLELVHQFNEGDVPVFLISLKAGGTGLNLTGADVVIHYDPWWNLAAQNQATDRAHRIGQTKEVTVYRLIAKGTIEENILKMQEAKKDLAEAILEGESTSLMSLSPEELLELLK